MHPNTTALSRGGPTLQFSSHALHTGKQWGGGCHTRAETAQRAGAPPSLSRERPDPEKARALAWTPWDRGRWEQTVPACRLPGPGARDPALWWTRSWDACYRSIGWRKLTDTDSPLFRGRQPWPRAGGTVGLLCPPPCDPLGDPARVYPPLPPSQMHLAPQLPSFVPGERGEDRGGQGGPAWADTARGRPSGPRLGPGGGVTSAPPRTPGPGSPAPTGESLMRGALCRVKARFGVLDRSEGAPSRRREQWSCVKMKETFLWGRRTRRADAHPHKQAPRAPARPTCRFGSI